MTIPLKKEQIRIIIFFLHYSINKIRLRTNKNHNANSFLKLIVQYFAKWTVFIFYFDIDKKEMNRQHFFYGREK